MSRLLLIDTANDTSGAWLPHLAAGRLACGDQSGRTSAPINPHAVQTIRGHKDRTGISFGSQSAFMAALWLHQPESQ